MVDLHCHILPNFDDGAKNIDEMLAMAEIAVKEGITTIVATPHYIEGSTTTTTEDLLKRVAETNQILEEKGIPLKVLPGNEAYISPTLPTYLKKGEVLTINNSSYVLVEFPMGELPLYTEDILYELRLQGYRPIIAHPERYRRVIENPNLVKAWIDQGNYIQVNSLSVTGGLGAGVQQTAEILVKHNMVHFIGTDAHSPRGRAPKLKKALKQIEEWVGIDTVNMLAANGEKVIKDNEVKTQQPKAYAGKKKFWDIVGKIFTQKQKKAYN